MAMRSAMTATPMTWTRARAGAKEHAAVMASCDSIRSQAKKITRLATTATRLTMMVVRLPALVKAAVMAR